MKNKIIFSFLAIFAGVAFVFGGANLSDYQRKFLRERTKLVNRDTTTIDGFVIDTFRKGDEFWQTTNKLSRINFEVRPKKLSKLKMIYVLKDCGKWDTVKIFINQNDLVDEWNACQFITTDFPLFISATNTIIQSKIATEEQVKNVINLSIDEE